MMSNTRGVTLIAVKLALSLPILLLLTTILHEGAHFVAALMLGIPITHFTWFDPNYLAPVLISGSTEYSMGMEIVSYAGGLVTGILLLVAVV